MLLLVVPVLRNPSVLGQAQQESSQREVGQAEVAKEATR